MTTTTTELTAGQKDILSFFPTNDHIKSPRKAQEIMIKEIDKAFASGKKYVLLEAPVGSGKSAVAMNLARAYGTSHIITPRKSLQDQYFEDFPEHITLMKGRNAYPCTYESEHKKYLRIVAKVDTGRVDPPKMGEPNCSTAPCRDNVEVFNKCTKDRDRVCPYQAAMLKAQEHESVIHNIHSFIFQTAFTEKFQERDILIVDECHEIPGAIRDFITKKIVLNKIVTTPLWVGAPVKTGLLARSQESEDSLSYYNQKDGISIVEKWINFFLQDKFVPEETDLEKARKQGDPHYKTRRDAYLGEIELLAYKLEKSNEGFVTKVSPVVHGGTKLQTGTAFEFVPVSLGSAPQNILFDYGKKVLLMSGTIYDKDTYCRYVGLNPADVYFLRVPSSFPVENRPVYLKADYQVDTSYANWAENFPEMIDKVKKILDIFPDVKGLIHTPSYFATDEVCKALNDQRILAHGPNDFNEKLSEFYASDKPLVFMSPVCQQGVDFKNDRARFQIILRVPNLSTSDAFVADRIEKDFPWYNYQTLITLGQQLGRVNRSETDFGATFLLDSRFNRFVSKNSRLLPTWLKNAMIWR